MGKWLALIVLSCLIGLAGCEKNTGATTKQSGPTGGKIRIVFIPKNAGNPYFDTIIEGFKKAASENNAEFSSISPFVGDATSQIPLIKDQIQRGVTVLAIAPNSPETLNPALKEARDKGIIVLTVDADLTGNEQYRDAAVWPVEAPAVGESQVEIMGSLIGYSGKFAILSATTDAPNQNNWIAVMKDTLKNNPKYKDMQLVDIVYGNDDPQKCQTESEALLTKYPDLKGILSPTTVGIVGAAQAVQSRGKADQVKVTGLGTPNQMRRFVKDGVVKAFGLWSPFDQGYLAGQVACQLANKTLQPGAGVTFKAGSLGERTFKDKNIVITDKPTVFTAENIDKYNF
jgi:rhamnose transport system substrate-binding protein